ncbi:MAG: hypothetical protein UX72_C0001G0026 [Parcubacteria group bacterium GW2011_GWA2_47_10]|nr:MAG: hypothetical protein UX72_C0001G0026 [Parcubacteria group bacterium GW2011_GWA2_47_10]
MLPQEQSLFDKELHGWWWSRFGISFASRHRLIDGEARNRPEDFSDKSVGLDESSSGGVWSGTKIQYWVSQLRREIDILPDDIVKIIQQKPEKLALDEQRRLKRYVHRRGQSIEFAIQKKDRISELKKRIQSAENGADPFEGEDAHNRRKVFFDSERDLFYIKEGQERRDLGVGDLLADYAWGITYDPDGSVPEKKRRMLIKKLALNEARREIEKIYDSELSAIYEISQGAGAIGLDKIENKAKKLYNLEQERAFGGIIAERAVREFLTRLSLNNQKANFFVERSNAAEDSQYKYDFKVRRRSRTRGVAIEGKDMPRDEYVRLKKEIGFQLTVTGAGPSLKKKEDQLEEAREKIKRTGLFVKRRVEDIALLSLSTPRFGDYFRRWLEEGKPSGGPEQYFSEKEKHLIINTISHNFLPPEEAALPTWSPVTEADE